MKHGKTLLITRPNYDPTTQYCYYWSENVKTFALEKSFRVLDIEGPKVTKKIFESYIKKQEPQLLFLNGHGSSEIFAGQDDEPILESSNIIVLTKETILYVRSCNVGSGLGKEIGAIGMTFIGYSKAFGFMRMDKYLRNPTKDPLAKFSLEPSNLVITTLLKGKTVSEAHERSKKAMQRNLQYLLSSKATNNERNCASLLWRNYKYQVMIGNKDAYIE